MEYFPFQTDPDELAHAWAGISLIETGKPISWSVFGTSWLNFGSAYRVLYGNLTLGDPQLNAQVVYPFYNPWFDHPPLLALIIGGWLKLWGYSFPDMYPSFYLHLPMIIISIITLWLIYKIAEICTNKTSALVALIFFSFSPSIALIQRMVVGENLYISFVLGALYAAFSGKSKYIIVVLLVLAGLTKVPGLIGIFIVSFYYLLKKEYKHAMMIGGASTLIYIALYSAYGFAINWPAFLTMLKFQTFRLIGWLNPVFILSHPGFHKELISDATYYLLFTLGLIGIFHSKKTNKQKAVIFGTAIAFAINWLTSNEQDMLGWYKIPLFSFLAITISFIGNHLISLGTLSLFLIAVLNNLGIFHTSWNDLPPIWLIRTLVGLLVVFITLLSLSSKDTIKKYLVGICLFVCIVIYIVQSFVVIDNYYDHLCQNKNCPRPLVTFKTLLSIP